ncbi:hypothetical protein GJ496_007697 [Pomphorhynchus laevis]|nr:hypothetical protein GJ496_007697 [Pomphorhynchus laevis]
MALFFRIGQLTFGFGIRLKFVLVFEQISKVRIQIKEAFNNKHKRKIKMAMTAVPWIRDASYIENLIEQVNKASCIYRQFSFEKCKMYLTNLKPDEVLVNSASPPKQLIQFDANDKNRWSFVSRTTISRAELAYTFGSHKIKETHRPPRSRKSKMKKQIETLVEMQLNEALKGEFQHGLFLAPTFQAANVVSTTTGFENVIDARLATNYYRPSKRTSKSRSQTSSALLEYLSLPEVEVIYNVREVIEDEIHKTSSGGSVTTLDDKEAK